MSRLADLGVRLRPEKASANKKERAGGPALDRRLTPKPELLRVYLVGLRAACKGFGKLRGLDDRANGLVILGRYSGAMMRGEVA